MLHDKGLMLAIRVMGSKTALADALRVSRQAVSRWHRVPPERVLEVERLTKVRRSLLRPDIYRADQ